MLFVRNYVYNTTTPAESNFSQIKRQDTEQSHSQNFNLMRIAIKFSANKHLEEIINVRNNKKQV